MQLRIQHIKLRRKSHKVMTSSLPYTSYVVAVKRATEQKTFKLFYPFTLQRICMQQHMTRTALSFVLESAFTLKESFAFVFVQCTCSYICSSVLSYVCSCICNTLLLWCLHGIRGVPFPGFRGIAGFFARGGGLFLSKVFLPDPGFIPGLRAFTGLILLRRSMIQSRRRRCVHAAR